MPILGTVASQFAGKPFASFESIQTATVDSGGTSYIEFTSIPASYTHLQLRLLMRTNRSTYTIDNWRMTFNNDTSTNYSDNVLLSGPGSPATPSLSAQPNIIGFTFLSSTTVINNTFSVAVIDILDYKNTNKYKSIRGLVGHDTNGIVADYGGHVLVTGGAWRNTDAITSIKFVPATGSLITQYSKASLYGIVGS